MFRVTRRSISNLSVIGVGSMGAGIAQVSAQAGMHVTMIDLDEKALGRAMTTIDKSVSRVIKKKFANNPAEANNFKDMIMSNMPNGSSEMCVCEFIDKILTN